MRNLDTLNSTNIMIIRELQKKLAEPRLKNTGLEKQINHV